MSIRTDGIVRTVRRAWFGALRWHTFNVYACDTVKCSDSDNQDTEFSLAVAGPDDLNGLQSNANFEEEAFVSRYLRCSECLIGQHRGQQAHILWVFRAGDASRFFDLNEDEAEVNYCFTSRQFRGQGMYRKTLAATVRYLHKKHINRVYAVTHDSNEPANRAIRAAGFERMGLLRHCGFLYRPKWRADGTPVAKQGSSGI